MSGDGLAQAQVIVELAEAELAAFLRSTHAVIGCADPLTSGSLWINTMTSLHWPAANHKFFSVQSTSCASLDLYRSMYRIESVSSQPANGPMPRKERTLQLDLLLLLPKSSHGLFKHLVGVRVRQGTCSHLQAVVQRRIQQVNHRVWVYVRPQPAFTDALLKVSNGHPPSWHGPAFFQGFGDIRTVLGLGQKDPQKRSVFAAQCLSHRAHLQANAFQVICGGSKEGGGVDPGHERVHDDRSFVGPSPVDRHPANASSSRNGIYAHRPQSMGEHELRRCLQHEEIDPWIARAPPLCCYG
jgi:hypothetical protein